jgi:hypothetical protein
MNTKIVSLLALALFCGTQAPGLAQTYHREYGGSRVIQQNMTGLYTPSATYIGAGTLSRSAQGKSAGVGGALPAVNMGSTVRTPGDNLYNNDGTDRQTNGALIYQDTELQMIKADFRKAQVQQRRAYYQARQQHLQETRGNLYIPGSNTGTSTYGSVPSGQMQYRNNGAATYGDNLGNPKGTRAF